MIKKISLLIILASLATSCDRLKQGRDYLEQKGILHQSNIMQGNVFNMDQVKNIKDGMSKAEVVRLMGSPMITDPFHANQWDYVNSSKIKGNWRRYRVSIIFEPKNGLVVAVNYSGDIPQK